MVNAPAIRNRMGVRMVITSDWVKMPNNGAPNESEASASPPMPINAPPMPTQ